MLVGQKTRPLHEILTQLVITEKAFSGVFGLTKGPRGLQHHNFFIFDGKQHPKNIWFRGC